MVEILRLECGESLQNCEGLAQALHVQQQVGSRVEIIWVVWRNLLKFLKCPERQLGRPL
jgi:hypothetical protein